MKHCGNDIKNFTENEFPEDVHNYADPGLMARLQLTRELLGAPIDPSRADGALARFDFTGMTRAEYEARYGVPPSMHQFLVGKRSTAIDWFARCPPADAFMSIVRAGVWDGIGVYFNKRDNDGKPRVMFHTDFGRKTPFMWFETEGGERVRQYSENFPRKLFALLADRNF